MASFEKALILTPPIRGWPRDRRKGAILRGLRKRPLSPWLSNVAFSVSPRTGQRGRRKAARARSVRKLTKSSRLSCSPTVLFDQGVDQLGLLLVHPAGERRQEQLELDCGVHGARIIRERRPLAKSRNLGAFAFSDTTRFLLTPTVLLFELDRVLHRSAHVRV